MKKSSVDKVARLGFLAKGAIYLIMGALAAAWAFGEGGQITGGQGVVAYISQLPAGSFLLGLLAIGLAAYALFRFIQAAGGGHSSDDSAIKRIGRAASGLIHGFLAFTCLQALGFASAGGSKKSYLGELMASDGGRWLVVTLGLIVIGAAFYNVYKAAANHPAENLQAGSLSRSAREGVVKLGRFGLAARGVVFFVIGYFLVQAGLAASPGTAKGTGAALREIASQSYGTILLAIVALGFVAYGIYMVASARYRRVAA